MIRLGKKDLRRGRGQKSFVFEMTQRCNHECPHCYNAWKNEGDYPMGELSTGETLEMLDKMLDQTGASLVSLTGGEPMLRPDAGEIVDFLVDRGVTVNLITNGSLLDACAIAKLTPEKISVFELPLLSVEREIHDEMSGRAGAFDDSTMAVAELKMAGEIVVCVFVATRLNMHTWRDTAELAIALGADGIMLNRFNPGGEGGRNIARLQASPDEMTGVLEIAQEISEEYDFSISCSIAMPPCLFDISKYPRLGFGFCAAGTDRAYYTLDPLGNVRPCNHSMLILGNIRDGDFWEMADSAPMADFVAARPEFCDGCSMEDECLGGCKAAAEVCCGSPWKCDPFLGEFRGQARKPG